MAAPPPLPSLAQPAELFTPLTPDELAMLRAPSSSMIVPPVATTTTTTTTAAPSANPGRLGTMGTPAHAASPASGATTSPISGAMGALLPADGEIRTFSGGDTLDEPVSDTIMRDLRAIGAKLKRVCFPKGQSNVLRDYDLWGPLLLCLGLSITMSLTAPAEQTAAVFSGIFVIVWLGAGVVTLNAKLLGGTLSFFQSVCVLGYCIFPLFLASIVCLFIKWILIRAPIVAAAFLWSTYAALAFMTSVNLAGRRLLAVYPIYLFYLTLSWVIVISKALV